jgi:TRAP-type mannitol/chloroaromatic compound transport system substrate-binding protein
MDINNCIFNPKMEVKEKEEEAIELISCEDKNGNNNICAKKIRREDSSIKYVIKTDLNFRLYNPFSLYDQSEKYSNFIDNVCRQSNKFKEVSKKVFDFYTEFLKTKNVALLNNAEREVY